MLTKNERGANSIGVIALAALIFAITAVYISFATRSDLSDRLAVLQQNNTNDLDQLADLQNSNGSVLGVAESNDDQSSSPLINKETEEQTPEDIRFKPEMESNLGHAESNGVDLNALFSVAPSLVLDNFNAGTEIGKAWLAFYNGKTYLRLAAANLDDLYENNFYEAWMSLNADYGIMFSVGPLQYNASTSEAVLSVEIEGDVTDYSTILITLEPNDGLAKPYKILLKGEFPVATDFTVTDEMLEQSVSVLGSEARPTQEQGVVGGDSALLRSLLGNDTSGSLAQEDLLKALLNRESDNSAQSGANNGSLAEILQKLKK